MEGFLNLEDGIFKGKGISALKNSQCGYDKLIAMFGGKMNIPASIMAAKKTRASERDDWGAKRGYENTGPLAISGYKKEKPNLYHRFRVSSIGAASGALSNFPQNIGRSIVLFYSDPGQTIFDPFAGHNSRMDLCITAGRHYIGCDLSTDFMELNFRRSEWLRKKYKLANIELHHCDSRKVPIYSEVGDFTITSPPYWDIEFYGNEPGQLGKCKTYKEFLVNLYNVVKENFRLLKPGAYAVWFVNDFRKKNKLYLYHVDMMKLGRKAGFEIYDILIVDFRRGIRDCFPNQIIESRILPKRHEYGIVFRKPI